MRKALKWSDKLLLSYIYMNTVNLICFSLKLAVF